MDNGIFKVIIIKKGVTQGCVLSPALFNLYTEMIFRNIQDLPGIKINVNNLRYADTVLVADNEEKLQDIVNKVNAVGKY